jgi:eukaryotic-like serine/threonine-protein kinase
MGAILKDDPPTLPASVPAALDRVVRRCLEKAPDGSFQSAADLAFAVDIAIGKGQIRTISGH